MKNKKTTDTFLVVTSILTLVVAIIGATFAYFSAIVISDNVVNLEAAELSLGYIDNLEGLKTRLIPASNEIALYAGTNDDWINKKETIQTNEDGTEVKVIGTGACNDAHMNEVCGIYEFTFGNSSFTTPIDITAKVTVSLNQLENLWFAIYDESNTQVVEPTKFPNLTGGEVVLAGLEQRLLASSLDDNNQKFDPENPRTYTEIVDKKDPNNADKDTNVRTYRMVIWVKEMGIDQTKVDAGKIFIASISIQTAGGGMTGTFTASKK